MRLPSSDGRLFAAFDGFDRDRRAAAMQQVLNAMEASGLRLYDYIRRNPRFAHYPIGDIPPLARAESLNAGRIDALCKATGVGHAQILSMIRAAAPRIWDADRLCLEAGLQWPSEQRVRFSRERWLNRLTTAHHLVRTLWDIHMLADQLDSVDRAHVACQGIRILLRINGYPPGPVKRPPSIREIDASYALDPVVIAAQVLRILMETQEIYGLVLVSIRPFQDTARFIPLNLQCGIQTGIDVPDDTVWTDLYCARHRREEDPVALFSGRAPQQRYEELLDSSFLELDPLLYLFELLGDWAEQLKTRQDHCGRLDTNWNGRQDLIEEIEAAKSVIQLVSEII